MKSDKNNKPKYYSLDKILSFDATYNIIFGERSNGKTYAVLDYALREYFAGHGELAVIRRWDEDFRAKRGASLFSAHVQNGLISKYSKGKWNSVYYYSGRWYFANYDEKTQKTKKDEKPFAYAFSLNTMEHDKSTSFPNITTILFDEFLTRDAYIADEFVVFTNVLSTIIRQRNNVKIFMLGNTVNMYSPYWSEMGLNKVRQMKPGDIQPYSYGDSRLKVVVEYTEPNIEGKASDFYFAFDNPKLQMIKSGEWEIANYPHCPVSYKPIDVIFEYFIVFEEDILHAEVIQHDDLLFTFIHKKTTELKNTDYDLIYTTEYSPRPNYRRNILKPISKTEKSIYSMFKNDKVFYQDNLVGEIVRNYIQWCGQN